MAEMGGLAERQIAEAIEALTTRDSERAWRVINADAAIDNMQRAIEERAIETIREFPISFQRTHGGFGGLRVSPSRNTLRSNLILSQGMRSVCCSKGQSHACRNVRLEAIPTPVNETICLATS